MLRRLALVTPDFLAKLRRLVHQKVWQSPAFKRGKKYLSVYRVVDPTDPNDPGYFYVERVGRDSVAIVFYDACGIALPYRSRLKITQLTCDYHPPLPSDPFSGPYMPHSRQLDPLRPFDSHHQNPFP